MQHKGEKLADRKVQVRQSGLDERVEMFGQQPEDVGLLEMATSGGIRDTLQVLRWFLGQIGIRCNGKQVAQQKVQQQIARSVGKRGNPFSYSRANGSATVQPAQQSAPTQADEEIEGEDD